MEIFRLTKRLTDRRDRHNHMEANDRNDHRKVKWLINYGVQWEERGKCLSLFHSKNIVHTSVCNYFLLFFIGTWRVCGFCIGFNSKVLKSDSFLKRQTDVCHNQTSRKRGHLGNIRTSVCVETFLVVLLPYRLASTCIYFLRLPLTAISSSCIIQVFV